MCLCVQFGALTTLEPRLYLSVCLSLYVFVCLSVSVCAVWRADDSGAASVSVCLSLYVFLCLCVQFGALTTLEPRLGRKLIEPLTNLIHR